MTSALFLGLYREEARRQAELAAKRAEQERQRQERLERERLERECRRRQVHPHQRSYPFFVSLQLINGCIYSNLPRGPHRR